MEADEIRRHWETWARQYETDLRATTKTPTIKRLELNALYRALTGVGMNNGNRSFLEVGCGNGHNCLALASLFPAAIVTGVDYVPAMVENARALAAERSVSERVRFHVADAITLDSDPALAEAYDVVFTVRCLINLNTRDLQSRAFDQLVSKVRPGGHLVLIENISQTHKRQNDCRTAVGLPPREPSAFNLFLDDFDVRQWGRAGLQLVATDDFGALHDLVLYVLAPLADGGRLDYDHPLVAAATELSLATASSDILQGFPSVGQNRLYLFRKPL